ncbi:MAG: DUF262 domain-containing protein [Chloroflexales bacterium]
MSDQTEINDEQNDISDEERGTGVEREDVVGEDSINSPFDPTLIRVEVKLLTIDLLLARLREEEIDLKPSFQRKAGIWSDEEQSRLIESLLIKIPLPAFYFDATDDDRWIVIDGLQRLTALRRFAITEELKLTGLEFLNQLKDKGYKELPRGFVRRILEAQVTGYLIARGTPDEVKFTIFRRINTGGKPLALQEIRHALNQGQATELLVELAKSAEFQRAIDKSVSDERMDARALVLRFLAFARTSYTEYKRRDFDAFLNQAMSELNALPPDELLALTQSFKKTMESAYDIFGNDAFRKRSDPSAKRQPVNKSLFETWSVNLYRLNESQLQQLRERKEQLKAAFITLMNNEGDFVNAISQGTGDVAKVELRFRRIEQLIAEVLA